MPHVQAVLPQRKTYYGRLTRVIEPGRHVYQTKLSFISWAFALIWAGAGTFLAWAGFDILGGHYRIDAFVWGFAVMFWILALVFLGLMARTLSIRTTLVIGPSQVELRQRSFVFKPSIIRRWSMPAVSGTSLVEIPLYGVGGTATVYGVKLLIGNGEQPMLRTTFDFADEALAVIRDIDVSIRQAQDPELFQRG